VAEPDVGRAARPWPLAFGAALAAGTFALYVTLLAAERNDTGPEVALFAAPFLVAIGLAAGGIASHGPRRRRLSVAAGVLLLILGVVGLFSIGMPLIVAGALCLLQLRMSSD
jgi:hypothetical protein